MQDSTVASDPDLPEPRFTGKIASAEDPDLSDIIYLPTGMAALQETLHQIMMTNSELNRNNTSLSEEMEDLRVRNKNLTQER